MLVWVYFRIEARVYADKKESLRAVTGVAFSLMAEYEGRVKSGELTAVEAQQQAVLRIKNLRYEGQEYFWINDLAPKMVMHPFKPELDGTDLTGYKDPNGKHLFVEFVKTCRAAGEGFVDYMWPKPGESKPVAKISYVKAFEPWGWVVGSGLYVDDLEKELASVRDLFLGVVLLFGLGGLVMSWLIARSTARPINQAISGLNANAANVVEAAAQMSCSSQRLAEGASQQAAALEETSASFEQISGTIKRNAENAGQA